MTHRRFCVAMVLLLVFLTACGADPVPPSANQGGIPPLSAAETPSSTPTVTPTVEETMDGPAAVLSAFVRVRDGQGYEYKITATVDWYVPSLAIGNARLNDAYLDQGEIGGSITIENKTDRMLVQPVTHVGLGYALADMPQEYNLQPAHEGVCPPFTGPPVCVWAGLRADQPGNVDPDQSRTFNLVKSSHPDAPGPYLTEQLVEDVIAKAEAGEHPVIVFQLPADYLVLSCSGGLVTIRLSESQPCIR